MNVVIVEDDVLASNMLVSFFTDYTIEKGREIKIDCYNSPHQFLEEFKSQYDLVLLDIQMPGLSGIQVAEKIRQTDENIIIVFITEIAQYAIAGYKVRAMDYILKPVSFYDFSYMVDNAFKILKSREQKSIVVTSKQCLVKILISSIYFIEVQNHKLYIHTNSETYETWASLSSIESELPQEMFSRINSGVTVNLNHVLSVNNDSVILPCGELPLSRRRKKEFCSNLARYFGGTLHV